MLSGNDRDWCHFYIDWERLTLIAKMDTLTGTDHRHLKMSYLILRKGADTAPGICDHDIHRVVSSPLKSKGKTELMLCGCDGALRRIRRLDKDSSEKNRAFADAMRGDIVRCASCEKITSADSFDVVKRFAGENHLL